MSSATATIKKEDRLFSLILALTSSRDGLTKGNILRSVRGYAEKFTNETDPTLDKLFERDKADLRHMGVVIDTFEFPEDEGQTHQVRYSISREKYELPANIHFSASETALLNLASAAWQDASLSAESRHALNKIRSLGVEPDNTLVGVAPKILTQDKYFTFMADALESNSIVSFMYLKPGENKATQRVCAPLGLANWRGRWYLLAHDMDVLSERTFLLSRIVSKPLRVPQKTFERVDANYAQRVIHELEALAAQQNASFRLKSGSLFLGEILALGAQKNSDETFTLEFADLYLLAEELTPLSSELCEVAPPALFEAIRFRLKLVAQVHGGM